MNLLGHLGAERRKLFLVRFCFPGADVSREARLRHKAGGFLGLDENLKVGLGARLAANLGQQERIDVAARRNEVQVAANAGLRGMHVAQIVRPVDDPEFLVSGGEVEDLFILGKNDQGREAQLRANRHNVFFRILHDPRLFGCGAHGGKRKGRNQQDHHECTHNSQPDRHKWKLASSFHSS